MPLPDQHQAIVAIATAPGRGAVGIVRVSGRGLGPLTAGLCGRTLAPRQAAYTAFLDASGQAIDRGLAIHFPAPHSYTGEDVLELQAHGGRVVLQLLLARCLEAAAEADPHTGAPRLSDLRLARPGEFTERAFLNDKLDLAQAEAVADLIEASTEAAARSAARSLSGEFSREIEVLRERIVRLRMLVEATLDFPEEEIDFLQRADAQGQLSAISAAIDEVLARARQGALLREGLQVVLAGQPNVGKSSLLNALAGAELAIVTPIPGTTRDKISQTIQIEGVPLHIIDTAGLRGGADAAAVASGDMGAEAREADPGASRRDPSASGRDSNPSGRDPSTAAQPHAAVLDAVERIGIARSWEAIAQADVVLFMHDLTRRGQADYEAAELDIAQRLAQCLAGGDASRLLHVHNKCDALGLAANAVDSAAAGAANTAADFAANTAADLAPTRPAHPAAGQTAAAPHSVTIAAKSGIGLPGLRQALLQRAGWQANAEGLFTARKRHVLALQRTQAHVRSAQEHAALNAAALDLYAEELRLAHDALAEITGAFSSDDLLGEIFSRFCIGK